MADPASNPYSKANYTPTGAGDPGRVAKLELLVVELRDQIVAKDQQLADKDAEIERLRGSQPPAPPRKASTMAADQVEHKVDMSKLPPALRSFDVLSEAEGVAKAHGPAAEVAALTAAVQADPSDAKAAAALGTRAGKMLNACAAEIDQRMRAEGQFKANFQAIRAGNEAFREVYGAVWRVVQLCEAGAFAAFKAAVAEVRATMPAAGTPVEQPQKDVAELFQAASTAKPAFDQVLRDVERSSREAARAEAEAASDAEGAADADAIALSLPATLKKVGRVVEKAALRRGRRGDVSGVKDVVRAMVRVRRFAHVCIVLLAVHRHAGCRVVRIKERYFEMPSGGGWRDLMINIEIDIGGGAVHICEVQVVHEMMLMARKALPGHAVYNRVRNATELLECKLGAAVAGDALALAWLHEATGGGKRLGSSQNTEKPQVWQLTVCWAQKPPFAQ